MTLRRRLGLSITALILAVSAVIGASSIIALATIQTNSIDSQIESATKRAQKFVDSSGFGGGRGGGFQNITGQGAGTLTAVFLNGTQVTGFVLQDDGSAEQLTDAQAQVLGQATVGTGGQTVHLRGNEGDYRVAAVATSNGVLVIGLPMNPVYESVWRLVWVVVIVLVISLIAGAVVAAYTVRRSLRPLQRVAETASAVARMPLESSASLVDVRVPDTDPRTEVGRVGMAFNRMLGHIGHAMEARERSEAKVRQFVADASHELRTPLASIRGYAELTRRMGGELPHDVVYAMGRVESESVRMTALVEDLLLLARLDEGREIQFDDVDLTGIVLDAVNDAHAASPEHPIAVDVPEEPVIVVGDAARLHQVVVNLITNARTHTPDGTRITVGVEQTDNAVDLSVRDNGQGIDPEFLPKLFERFARADSSRSRIAGSTGLGLAIVDAVVQAHGGTVHVQSVPGNTVFTVHLPIAAPTDAAAAVAEGFGAAPAPAPATGSGSRAVGRGTVQASVSDEDRGNAVSRG